MNLLVVRIGFTAAALGIALAANAADPLSSKGFLMDRVAAVVNDGVVTTSELAEQTESIEERLRAQNLDLPPPDVLRKQVLDRLVVQEIQLQRADRVGIKISEEQLNAALSDVAQRNNLTLAQLPEALAAQRIDYASYRENMRKEITLTGLRQREMSRRVNITPRELDQFIEKQKKLPSELNEYNVSHILIAVPQNATPAEADELASKAQDIYARARGGEDFARLAIANSNSQTALEGGSLGWRKGPELPTFLADSVIRLQAGEVGEPVRTPSGFHIVRVNEVRGVGKQQVVDQIHARHILIKTNALQDDATVRLRLAGIRERILKGEDFAVLATTLSEDTGSAINGGDLGWSNPGTFVRQFDTALEILAENEISEPFQTEFGWHIVQLLGKRKFDTTDEVLRERAFAQLRESKAEEATELWLRELRDEAFVEYKL